jgi:bifunctional DNA-binding transcriptional regulator/antitoxin component of YhaV-PrlF toxin-antitoxin module
VLERLAALSDASSEPPRWWHWIAGLDGTGRLTLPVEARRLAGDLGLVRVSSHADAVVLRREGIGAAMPVDRRGRVLLPDWFRRRVDAGPVFVAACRLDASVVVVTPACCLDVIADALVQGVG